MPSISGDNDGFGDAMRRQAARSGLFSGLFGDPVWTRASGWADRPRAGDGYVDDIIARGEAWDEPRARDGIATISEGGPCAGCGAEWRADDTPGQRIMSHHETCPYTRALVALGI